MSKTTDLNLHNKKFVTINNHEGLSSDETIFHYYEENDIITGQYKGGAILEGFVVGKRTGDHKIELLFQCITDEGELRTGESKGIISLHQDNKLGLKFDWKWLNGDLTGGKSEYIELK